MEEPEPLKLTHEYAVQQPKAETAITLYPIDWTRLKRAIHDAYCKPDHRMAWATFYLGNGISLGVAAAVSAYASTGERKLAWYFGAVAIGFLLLGATNWSAALVTENLHLGNIRQIVTEMNDIAAQRQLPPLALTERPHFLVACYRWAAVRVRQGHSPEETTASSPAPSNPNSS